MYTVSGLLGTCDVDSLKVPERLRTSSFLHFDCTVNVTTK